MITVPPEAYFSSRSLRGGGGGGGGLKDLEKKGVIREWLITNQLQKIQLSMTKSIQNECCLNESSRLWGGVLCDDTKNSCEGD